MTMPGFTGQSSLLTFERFHLVGRPLSKWNGSRVMRAGVNLKKTKGSNAWAVFQYMSPILTMPTIRVFLRVPHHLFRCYGYAGCLWGCSFVYTLCKL